MASSVILNAAAGDAAARDAAAPLPGDAAARDAAAPLPGDAAARDAAAPLPGDAAAPLPGEAATAVRVEGVAGSGERGRATGRLVADRSFLAAKYILPAK
jgi:hypothetical protein